MNVLPSFPSFALRALVHCAVFILLSIAALLPAAEVSLSSDATSNTDSSARALLNQLADGDRTAALDAIAKRGDVRLLPALDAFSKGMLARRDGRIVLFASKVDMTEQGQVYPVLDALTQKPVPDAHGAPQFEMSLPADVIKAKSIERKRIRGIAAALELRHPDPAQRRKAIITVADNADTELLEELQRQHDEDIHGPYANLLNESIARIRFAKGSAAEILAATETLGGLRSTRSLPALSDKRKQLQSSTSASSEESKSADIQLGAALDRAITAIEARQQFARYVYQIFSGLSLGSILILLALGLSIIFGLMGVINMAHGELMMIGAFTSFLVSKAFESWLPGWYDWYLIAAIPCAFLVSGMVGWLIEMLVIRHLYGRPLETLLATFGLSLILIQAVRVGFGDNLAVKPPSWLTGGITVTDDIVLPANRLFIIALCAACVIGMYLVIRATRLGLLLRATTQNRAMASCLGVATRRIDGMTFGLGAGLAGIAGVAVPLYDKISPTMGQNVIVESFLVVVTGGVGNLAGVVWAGLGLGFASKLIEPFLEVVFTKVVMLGFIILFLQWKPSGLFPAKGRLADV